MFAKLCVVLALGLLAVSVSSLSFAPAPILGGLAAYPLATYNVDDVCASVGRLTGCSGCTHGTKGLCSWVKADTATGAAFSCLPSTKASEEEVLGVSSPAGFLCPADPTKEPLLDLEVRKYNQATQAQLKGAIFSPQQGTIPGFFNPVASFPAPASSVKLSYATVSEIFSKSFNTGLFKTADNNATVTVDRTSLWGELGFAKLGGYGAFARHDVTCPNIAQEDLFDIHQLSDDTEQLYSERIRYCLIHHLHVYYNFRCTPYGVAKSGICQSAFEKFIESCGGVDQQAFTAVTSGDGPTLTRLHSFLVDVVQDDTPFCVKDDYLTASAHAVHLAGLDKPLVQES